MIQIVVIDYNNKTYCIRVKPNLGIDKFIMQLNATFKRFNTTYSLMYNNTRLELGQTLEDYYISFSEHFDPNRRY